MCLTRPLLPAALALLLCNYVGAIVLAWRLPHAFNVPLMVGAHAALALLAIHYTRVGSVCFSSRNLPRAVLFSPV